MHSFSSPQKNVLLYANNIKVTIGLKVGLQGRRVVGTRRVREGVLCSIAFHV